MVRGKAQVSMYETAEAKRYKKDFANYIVEQIEIQNWDIEPNKTQHFYIDCVFYFDRVDKDPNNYFKLILDAITDTQLIWLDDNVTCERVHRIYYDSKNPRIEITIKPVDYVGIFDNIDHLNEFEEKCKKCTRYSRNCSLLKNAKIGKIQEEISVECICSKYKMASVKTNKKEK